jgi:ribosomal protein S6
VLVYGEASGVLLESRVFLWGYMKDLVYSIAIDIIEVLRKRVENAATTIRNNRGMLERVEELFRRRLHYCIDNNGGHFEHFL